MRAHIGDGLALTDLDLGVLQGDGVATQPPPPPTSKLTLVRFDGRWKTSASDRPSSGLPTEAPRLGGGCEIRIEWMSAASRSAMERR